MIGVKKNINILLKDVKGICIIKIDLAEIKMSRFNLQLRVRHQNKLKNMEKLFGKEYIYILNMIE